MADGDAAAAIGWPVVNSSTTPANEIGDEINVSRDLAASVYTETRPIARGGTGATTAAAARTALGIPAITPGNSSAPNTIPTYSATNQLTTSTPTLAGHAANKAYVDAVAPPAFNGGVVTGQIYLVNAFLANTGYAVCYINGDGRISRGASSSRFKKDIDRQPVPEGFSELVASYLMRADGDGVTRFGPIVEDMLKAGGDKAALVTFDGEGRPESFDQISYLMACVAELSARVKELEAR